MQGINIFIFYKKPSKHLTLQGGGGSGCEYIIIQQQELSQLLPDFRWEISLIIIQDWIDFHNTSKIGQTQSKLLLDIHF